MPQKSTSLLEFTVLLCMPFLVVALLGCSVSTTFKPPSDHIAYLGMEGDEFALIRDSVVVKISDEPRKLLGRSELAYTTAGKATASFRSGRIQLMSGAFLSFLIPIVGIPLELKGAADVHTGVAELIDAMNIYNDQPDSLPSAGQTPEITIPDSVEIRCGSRVSILDERVHISCVKKRESLFYSRILLSFEGDVSVDQREDGKFKQTSLKVKKDDRFYVRTKSLVLRVEVVQESEQGVTLTFKKL